MNNTSLTVCVVSGASSECQEAVFIPLGLNSCLLGDLGLAFQIVVFVPHPVLPVSWGGVVTLPPCDIAFVHQVSFVGFLQLPFQGVQLCLLVILVGSQLRDL